MFALTEPVSACFSLHGAVHQTFASTMSVLCHDSHKLCCTPNVTDT